MRTRYLLLGVAFLALSLVLSLPLVRRITRPLAQLTASTEAASQGHFGQRIDIRTNDEIGTLAAGFNRMLAQLRSMSVAVEPDVREEFNGRFAWVLDPEGNKIELWEPKASH